MAKFVFKLEGVLRQRHGIEQQRQRELAAVQSRMTLLETDLRNLDSSMRGAEQDLRNNRLTGRLDLGFLAAHRRYAFAMQRKALGIAQKMATVRIAVDEARKNLVEAAKRRKAIDKLRERQFLRWQQHLARLEAAALDEVTTQMTYQAQIEEQAQIDSQARIENQLRASVS